MERYLEEMDRRMVEAGVADEGVRDRQAQRRLTRAREQLAAQEEARAAACNAADAPFPESQTTLGISPKVTKPKRRGRDIGYGTEAALVALGAYLKHLKRTGADLPISGLATKLFQFATKYDIPDAETAAALNPDGSLGDLMKAVLHGYNDIQLVARAKSTPKAPRKPPLRRPGATL
jgi:hypothetical protein